MSSSQPAPFSIVGCTHCSVRWIVEDLRHQQTVTCPSCGSVHQSSKLRALAKAKTIEQARELRGRINVDRSDVDYNPDEHSYIGAQDAVDELGDDDPYAEEAEASMQAFRERYSAADTTTGHLDDWDDLYESAYTGAFEEYDRLYEDLVDESIRQFEASEASDRQSDDGSETSSRRQCDGSITYTDETQRPLSPVAEIGIGDQPPTGVWQSIVSDRAFITAVVRAIRECAAGKDADEFRMELTDRPLPAGYEELAVRIAKGDPIAVGRLWDDLGTLATGTSSLDEARGALSLLEGGDEPPLFVVRIAQSFFDRRADHREEICKFISTLAQACDVRVIVSRGLQRKLAANHGDVLRGVTEACRTTRPPRDVEATIETARGALDPDGVKVRMLRELAKEPARVLSYSDLEVTLPVVDSTVRRYANQLSGLDLVATYTGNGGGYLELLETGSVFLEALDRDIGRQSSIDSCVTGSGNPSIYCRVSPEREGGEDGIADDATAAATAPADRRRHGTAVNTAHMEPWREAALAASATDGAISLVDHPVAPSDELRQPYLSYLGTDRLVVGAEYSNPMQWAVCAARALTDRRVFSQVLTPERLDGKTGSLGGLATDDTRILRDGRCTGWLKDEDATGSRYAEALMAAEDELLDMTRRWHTGEFSCSPEEYRSRILRFAHGLIGTVAHLCDLADVELIREVRLPEFTRRFDAQNRRDLAKTLSFGARISSRYGHFAAYRQLFEHDEEKRAGAMEPTISPDDATGEMIGSYVVVGDHADRLESELTAEIRGTTDEDGEDTRIHEDAPEFTVPVSITTDVGRSAVALTAREILAPKNLSPTREAVALLDALTGSPLDVAKALSGLEAEDSPRDIRLDEVRFALSELSTDRITPTMQPTVSKTIHALLTTATPLTQSDLADRAGVSARSLRTHLPRLEALGLVSLTEAGIRFQLPFRTGEERGRDILPGLAKTAGPDPVDVLYELAEAISGEAAHDPETPIGAAFFADDWVAELRRLPVYDRWLDLAYQLTQTGLESAMRIVAFGKEPKQTALPTREVTA